MYREQVQVAWEAGLVWQEVGVAGPMESSFLISLFPYCRTALLDTCDRASLPVMRKIP